MGVRKSVSIYLVAAGLGAVVMALPPAAGGKAPVGRLASPSSGNSCHLEVEFAGRRYRPVRLPRQGWQMVRRKLGRAAVRCEARIVCQREQSCRAKPGAIRRVVAVRRIRGVSRQLAVVTTPNGRVYVNRQRIPVLAGGKQLLRLLKRGGGPPPDTTQAPPLAALLSARGPIPLARGDFCWTRALGDDKWVRSCARMAPPFRRYDLPLIVAEPGAQLDLALGFEPDHVRVRSFGRRQVYYDHALPAASTLSWVVAPELPARTILEFAAGHPFSTSIEDEASYLARLRIVGSP
jgi:hypothetical protein